MSPQPSFDPQDLNGIQCFGPHFGHQDSIPFSINVSMVSSSITESSCSFANEKHSGSNMETWISPMLKELWLILVVLLSWNYISRGSGFVDLMLKTQCIDHATMLHLVLDEGLAFMVSLSLAGVFVTVIQLFDPLNPGFDELFTNPTT